MFIMTLGGFGNIWEEIHETHYIFIGDIDNFLNLKYRIIINAPKETDAFPLLDLSIYLLLSCFFRKDPLVPVHRSAGDPSSQFAHCHDGVRMTMMVAPMKIYDDENHGDDDTN